ncbi:unnamed protein product [Gadus morhua 'NCC']
MFGRVEGGGPTQSRMRRPGRRQVTIKVSILKEDIAVYRCHQENVSTFTVVVQDTLSHEEFQQALRNKVPNIPEASELCRLIGQQSSFVRLDHVCPRDLRGRNVLGRSNLYIRPKVAAAAIPSSNEVKPPLNARIYEDEVPLPPAGKPQPASQDTLPSPSPPSSPLPPFSSSAPSSPLPPASSL